FAFQGAGAVLLINIWAGVFVGLGVARSGWIISQNLQFYSMLYLLLGAIMNIILNYYLISFVGVVGAALSTLISQFLVVMIFPLLFNKTRLMAVMMFKALLFSCKK